MIDLNIVKMDSLHISHLAKIETECFSAPWSEKALGDELSNSYARFFVAMCGDDVAGYIGAHNILGEVYITNVRHKSAIAEGMKSLSQVRESIENGMPEDFYSIDLMNAYEVLGEIIGESVGEDLVNTIFKEFCMGK